MHEQNESAKKWLLVHLLHFPYKVTCFQVVLNMKITGATELMLTVIENLCLSLDNMAARADANPRSPQPP